MIAQYRAIIVRAVLCISKEGTSVYENQIGGLPQNQEQPPCQAIIYSF